ncbi:MAG: transposase [Thermoleophilia bacterium]|nr:transposase [Thermoleophilia bacterium]
MTGPQRFCCGVAKTGDDARNWRTGSAIKDDVPSRNVIKRYRNDAFFHAYNRGINGDEIFVDNFDRQMFLAAFVRRLPSPDVSLVAYCLMPNHFHLVLRQRRDAGITRLMRPALTSYVRQFNGRHRRFGGLFQGVFKASDPLTKRAARSVVAYVHLNPIDLRRGVPWEEYEFSSHRVFL